jgi:hypothetical protein
LGVHDAPVQGLDPGDGLDQIIGCGHRVGHIVELSADVDGDDVSAVLG